MNEPVGLLYFGPISSLYEKNNPRNINYMPVVIFFVCLGLEPDSVDFEILVNQQTHKSLLKREYGDNP